jgi:hypothetical protein
VASSHAGAYRQGVLTVQCGAAQTSFNVNENPMCTYAMQYVTTQPCPGATTVAAVATVVTTSGGAVAGACNQYSGSSRNVATCNIANVAAGAVIGVGTTNIAGTQCSGACAAASARAPCVLL